MKIACSGTQCIGKSTFIDDFIQQWPMYSRPEKTYRDYIKEKGVKINREANKESQEFILNCQIDILQKYSKSDNIIFDRCPLDALVYSMWLAANDRGGIDDAFIRKWAEIVRESLSMLDIIFFFPICNQSPIKIEDDNFRDTDPKYREEIDTFFKMLVESYSKHEGTYFPKEDCPAVIEMFGTRQQRIEVAKLYIGDDGSVIGADKPLVTMEDIEEQAQLIKQFKNQ